ncbi:MAG: hypothetical protein H8D47_01180 [Planctomycetes bacterium]|nr:hypothetical protein [Planctomycetota bacterium]MBL7106133.1 hypothetical protein [Phycisphaerae bacterium]
MKSEKVYEDWKKQRSQIDVDPKFAEKVMKKVCQYEQKKKPLLDVQRFVEAIYTHTLAKAGMVAAGVVAGFIRMAFTVYMFLGT